MPAESALRVCCLWSWLRVLCCVLKLAAECTGFGVSLERFWGRPKLATICAQFRATWRELQGYLWLVPSCGGHGDTWERLCCEPMQLTLLFGLGPLWALQCDLRPATTCARFVTT